MHYIIILYIHCMIIERHEQNYYKDYMKLYLYILCMYVYSFCNFEQVMLDGYQISTSMNIMICHM